MSSRGRGSLSIVSSDRDKTVRPAIRSAAHLQDFGAPCASTHHKSPSLVLRGVLPDVGYLELRSLDVERGPRVAREPCLYTPAVTSRLEESTTMNVRNSMIILTISLASFAGGHAEELELRPKSEVRSLSLSEFVSVSVSARPLSELNVQHEGGRRGRGTTTTPSGLRTHTLHRRTTVSTHSSPSRLRLRPRTPSRHHTIQDDDASKAPSVRPPSTVHRRPGSPAQTHHASTHRRINASDRHAPFFADGLPGDQTNRQIPLSCCASATTLILILDHATGS